MKERNLTIDFLRALAIVLMFIMHATAYYLKDKFVYQVWNYAHFAVPIFIFCSAYLFFSKDIEKDEPVGQYLIKRIKRLLIPYYIFLGIYFVLVYFTRIKNLNPNFVWSSLILTDGIDINWLVLLFIQLTFLQTILKILIKKNILIFNIYYLLAILSTIILLTSNFQLNYRWYMWLPWSAIFIYAYFFKKSENNKLFLLMMTVIGLIVYLITVKIRVASHLSLVLFNSKYPPNLYYLTYGFVLMNAICLVSKQSLLNNAFFKKIYSFISQNSYSLFFIHYLVIYLFNVTNLQNTISWFVFFTLVTCSSILIQWLVNSLLKNYSKK